MPITPDEAIAHVTPAEEEAFKAICTYVDEQVKLIYQGDWDAARVTFPKQAGFTRRVMDRLREAYNAAGWGTVCIYQDRCLIELAKYKPSYGSSEKD